MTTNLMWSYPWDLLDEGVDDAVGRMHERAGVTDVAVTTFYHAGKFLHPNNPRRRLVFPVSSTLYFRPDPAWHGRLRLAPPVWPGLEEADPWPQVREACDARGMGVTAWTLTLHSSGIGERYPDTTVENAYGDRIVTDLSAAHPDVADLLVAMTRDIAEHLPVDRIMLESLEYMPFQHGYHHEVLGVPTGPTVGMLMALDFSEPAVQAAADQGVDVARVRGWVVETLDRHFADPFAGHVTHGWAEVRAALGGEVGRFLDVRRGIVRSLTERVISSIREASDATVALCDFGPLYAMPPDGTAWESGMDLAVTTELADEVHPTLYLGDPAANRQKLVDYLALVGDADVGVIPAIRAILPQTSDAAGLEAQVRNLDGLVDGASFYNYGFMARQALDWIGASMSTFSPRDR